jgi:hypothetical protein
MASVNMNYGFLNECYRDFPGKTMVNGKEVKDEDAVYKCAKDMFAELPLAVLLGKRILGVHSATSSRLESLNDIRGIKRLIPEPPDLSLKCDLLWSNPSAVLEGFQPNL